MSYRRFFDITDLAGVRVEDDDVFDATHSLIRDLAAEGVHHRPAHRPHRWPA
jgi:(1->4)-alpha-D-glucan 1-alpha-D-glucosylmutase